MIPSGARVLVATKPVDFRKGPEGLTALVREAGADPFSGALYVSGVECHWPPNTP